MTILNKEFQLNNIVELAYVTKKNQLTLVKGRICDFDEKHIILDMSENYIDLETIEVIKIDNIKYIRKIDNNMWRAI